MDTSNRVGPNGDGSLASISARVPALPGAAEHSHLIVARLNADAAAGTTRGS